MASTQGQMKKTGIVKVLKKFQEVVDKWNKDRTPCDPAVRCVGLDDIPVPIKTGDVLWDDDYEALFIVHSVKVVLQITGTDANGTPTNGSYDCTVPCTLLVVNPPGK